jgi:hypothetical protein
MVIRGATYERPPLDFFQTPDETTHVVFNFAKFKELVVDPCSGNGAILKILKRQGYKAAGGDLIRGYDFLLHKWRWPGADILTNPPFGPGGRTAVKFIERSLEVTADHRGKVALLLPVDFDSGKTRAHVFRDCPQFACKIVLLNRIRWFNNIAGSTNHCWCLWDYKHKGSPTISYAEQEWV